MAAGKMTNAAAQEVLSAKDLKISVTRSPGCQVAVHVLVDSSLVKETQKKAVKRISKEVSLPGFRKGKVPEEYLMANFGTHIKSEWEEELFSHVFRESFNLLKTYPLSNKSLRRPTLVKELSPEEPCEMNFSFEARPSVPDLDFKSLKLKSALPKEVPEEEVAATLERMRLNQAKREEVTDRAVQEGDFVTLNMFDLGTEPAKKVWENQAVFVAAGKLPGWLHKVLQGQKVGASLEAKSEPEASLAKEEAAQFKATSYKIELVKIEKPLLPEVDENFAKIFGATSVEDLRGKLQESLKHQLEAERQNELRHQVLDWVIEKCDFELPTSLCQEERQMRLKEKLKALKSEKVSDEAIKSQEKEIEAQVATEVDRSLHWTFFMYDTALKNNIVVSDREVMDSIVESLPAVRDNRQLLNNLAKNENLRNRVYNQILERKVQDFIISKIQK